MRHALPRPRRGGWLVALLLIALAIVVWRVDPNEFVAPLQARIKLATGRDVSIGSGIELKVSLTPRLVVHEFALANAPWGNAPQMVTAKELDIQVALLPLLHERFEVIRVNLVEPSIALETDAQGRTNWDFGGGPSGATPRAGDTPSPAAFGVGNVAVTNGVVTYRDGKSGSVTRVAIETLALSAGDAQAPVNVEFRGKADDVAVALTGKLGPLESLVQHRWPYPVALSGEIGGQKASLAAKLRSGEHEVRVEELEVALGPNTVKGEVTVTTGGARPRYTVNLTAAVLTLADAARIAVAPVKVTAAARASAPSRYVFSDASLPLAMLRTADAAGDVKVGRLVVSPTREFDAVEIRFTLQDGRLDVPMLKAATFGGHVDAHASLGVPASGAPVLAVVIDARNLDLGAELAALDVRRDVKGGKTSLKADLHAHGTSLHDWAASASGNVTAIAGPATIANAKLNLDTAFDQLAKVTNPFHDKDPTTELKCAVIRLPLADGIARIDRSVAAETQKLGLSVSGTLDLRNESVDLTFRPRLREGIPIDIPQIAELVRLRGPIQHPQVTIDATASVATVASNRRGIQYRRAVGDRRGRVRRGEPRGPVPVPWRWALSRRMPQGRPRSPAPIRSTRRWASCSDADAESDNQLPSRRHLLRESVA
jgi:uncharacterized protein involved in outer membrane biogenesis